MNLTLRRWELDLLGLSQAVAFPKACKVIKLPSKYSWTRQYQTLRKDYMANTLPTLSLRGWSLASEQRYRITWKPPRLNIRNSLSTFKKSWIRSSSYWELKLQISVIRKIQSRKQANYAMQKIQLILIKRKFTVLNWSSIKVSRHSRSISMPKIRSSMKLGPELAKNFSFNVLR